MPSETRGGDMPPLPSPERIQALLFDAARLGRIDVIPALLQAGADILAYDDRGYTPLILASYNGHADATALLLTHGAPVDQPDRSRGNTPLMGTVFKGHDGIARMLIDAGADVNATNSAGQSALMMAALVGRLELAEWLMDKGADVGLRDMAGNSASSVATSQGNEAMLARLSGRPVSAV